jgi:YD repeat-containing protein
MKPEHPKLNLHNATTSLSYDLAYDQENRLVQVKKNNVVMATFTYNGDGQRVKQTLNGVTTTFVGETYEITGAARNCATPG